ncbi:MAG: hypothetical protein HY686_05215 [Chloroflexi bacterium]|nr:hypothetical protein [Chloroflexota bacterium]
MGPFTIEGLTLWFQAAGFHLSQDEVARLKPLCDGYVERLKLLSSLDLEEEEVAGAFQPSWTLEQGGEA